MQMLTLNLPAIAKATAVEDIRTSFRPIEPGRYIVTLVNCNNGNSGAAMGFGNVGLLGVKGSNPQNPILGDNSIVIGKGEIVDAGIIDIVSTGSSGVFFKNETARLVGSEVPNRSGRSSSGTCRKSMPALPTGNFQPMTASCFQKIKKQRRNNSMTIMS